MKICISAAYDVKNPKSWSGTPLSLYHAVSHSPDVEITTVDLSSMHNKTNEIFSIIKHIDLSLSKSYGVLKSKLGPSVMNPLNSSLLDKYLKNKDFDVLIEFGGFIPGKNTPPYYIYTDSSRDMEIDFYKKTGVKPFGAENYTDEEMQNSSAYVKEIYKKAAGVFCMSNYLKESLVNTTGIDENKAHVVYAGANWHGIELPENINPKTIEGKKQFNILFTGIDYYRKGVDILIDAVKILNASSEMRFDLHLCGISEKITDDENVIVHGIVDKTKLLELLNDADLFVLPSRYECFGICFVEAMTFGIPCIGRNIMAMPEIIDEGENGELVSGDDPEELAALIKKICSDPVLYRKYSESAMEKSKIFQWDAVAEKMINIIKRDLHL